MPESEISFGYSLMSVDSRNNINNLSGGLCPYTPAKGLYNPLETQY